MKLLEPVGVDKSRRSFVGIRLNYFGFCCVGKMVVVCVCVWGGVKGQTWGLKVLKKDQHRGISINL